MSRSREQQIATRRLHAKIIRWKDDSLTDDQIAFKLKCSTATISRARRSRGLKKVAPYKGFQSGLTKAVISDLSNKWSHSNDDELALHFGVSGSTILKWRRKLGLFYNHKGKWSRYKHPRGFLGSTHSDEAKKTQSETSKRMWRDPNHKFNSEEYKDQVSERMSQLAVIRIKDKNYATKMYSRAKRGIRGDIGDHFFRSSWEANYARFLNLQFDRGIIAKWEYEVDTFWFEKIKRGMRSYTPDFKIWNKESDDSYYVEVKGWMDPKSKTKLKRMAKYYPQIKIELVDQKAYRELRRGYSGLIKGWE